MANLNIITNKPITWFIRFQYYVIKLLLNIQGVVIYHSDTFPEEPEISLIKVPIDSEKHITYFLHEQDKSCVYYRYFGIYKKSFKQYVVHAKYSDSLPFSITKYNTIRLETYSAILNIFDPLAMLIALSELLQEHINSLVSKDKA